MAEINNIQDLTNDLVKNYKNLCDGSLEPKMAKEISNMAGKIIGSAKVNLEYNKLMDKKTKIPFLEVNEG